jgi:hypothetical protein
MESYYLDTPDTEGEWANKLLLRGHINMLQELYPIAEHVQGQLNGHDRTYQITAHIIHINCFHYGMTAQDALLFLEKQLENRVKDGQITRQDASARINSFAVLLQRIMTNPFMEAHSQQRVD